MEAIPGSAVVTITEHSVPGRAQGIAAGPEDNVWFTQPQDVQIGRITPAGVVTEDDVPVGNSTSVGIAAGADGNLWFTHFSTNKIGKATTSSFVDEVSETVQLARTSRRFFDPPDRDQAVEDVDDKLGRGAWLRTRLVSRR
ncbi:virginiamycin B lyase family protein [Streptomyces akebiae]|uniref:Uncharacterized protein n=1 Tax=Streptomyces akebiae TaxID=2865673 RepID=A0ABX8XS34_9ACTN|nr:hypothetical protein [Streptomyces akebiae]QYX78419.1 hypothetical protein K1J60_19355 [Streptomyces akebiae]